MTNDVLLSIKIMDCGMNTTFVLKNNFKEGPSSQPDTLYITQVREWLPSENVNPKRRKRTSIKQG